MKSMPKKKTVPKNRKRLPRGIHLSTEETKEDNQEAQHNIPSETLLANVYKRKPNQVNSDPHKYSEDIEEHTTPRSIRDDSNTNDIESVNAAGHISVNQIEREGERTSAVDNGDDNVPPTGDDTGDYQQEANMLFFRNPPAIISSGQLPNFNLLSATDGDIPRNEPSMHHQTNTGTFNEAANAKSAAPTHEGVAPKKARKGRGRTKMKNKGRREPWEPKIHLEFDEEGKVCSDNATTFANSCGYYVRKYVPLQLETWEKVPSDALQSIFKKIMHHYNVPNDIKIKVNILKSCAKKYRAYRAYLKRKYFDAYETTEERMKNGPLNRMSEDDWAYLVKHFESNAFQVRSNRNKKNRDKQQCHQRLGTCSIAKLKSKMKKEGADSVRYRAYKKARLRPNGEPVDMESKEMMAKIETLARERGLDLDTAMDMVIPSRKRRDFSEVLQSVGIGASGGTLDVVSVRSQARAALAEKMAMQAQREADEAKQRLELLEMQLAQSQRKTVSASRGEAAAKAELARTRGELAYTLKEHARIDKTKAQMSSKRKLEATFVEDSSYSGGTSADSASQQDEGDSSSDSPIRSAQLEQIKSFQF